MRCLGRPTAAASPAGKGGVEGGSSGSGVRLRYPAQAADCSLPILSIHPPCCMIRGDPGTDRTSGAEAVADFEAFFGAGEGHWKGGGSMDGPVLLHVLLLHVLLLHVLLLHVQLHVLLLHVLLSKGSSDVCILLMFRLPH